MNVSVFLFRRRICFFLTLHAMIRTLRDTAIPRYVCMVVCIYLRVYALVWICLLKKLHTYTHFSVCRLAFYSGRFWKWRHWSWACIAHQYKTGGRESSFGEKLYTHFLCAFVSTCVCQLHKYNKSNGLSYDLRVPRACLYWLRYAQPLRWARRRWSLSTVTCTGAMSLFALSRIFYIFSYVHYGGVTKYNQLWMRVHHSFVYGLLVHPICTAHSVAIR